MLSEYRKAVVAVCTFLSLAVADELIAGTAGRWVTVALSALGAVGVWRFPNEPGILVDWDDLDDGGVG